MSRNGWPTTSPPRTMRIVPASSTTNTSPAFACPGARATYWGIAKLPISRRPMAGSSRGRAAELPAAASPTAATAIAIAVAKTIPLRRIR